MPRYYSLKDVKTMKRRVRDSEWEHVSFIDSHAVEPSWVANRGWRCGRCQDRIRIRAFVARDATPKGGN